jgi:hypothetical protein
MANQDAVRVDIEDTIATVMGGTESQGKYRGQGGHHDRCR